ncbi:uncharacterized protein LOC112084604 [Eutrema salsugineum]|uniref:uncharacterized protein LOC112084604 n=1 Tax=Eutrema salsugineum TaxID=72664 RepID=UPI000CED3197|nr:uncharacterized protein LOC112084604 [Eutrema salsugineum]
MDEEEEDFSTRFDGCEDPDCASSDDEEYGRSEKCTDGGSSDDEKQLHRVIPDDEGLAIISDRHRSIRNAIGKIQEANPALHAYLVKADICMWSRVHFQGYRYNFTTSNIAESLNKVLSAARVKPIVRLVDGIRSLLTRWFAKRHVNANNMEPTLTTGIENLLETFFAIKARVEDAKLLPVQEIDQHRTEVLGITSAHVVNLIEKTCTCRRFDLEKIPCVHAIAAADRKKLSPISLCHHYYHTSYLQQAYAVSIMPRDVALPVPDEVHTKICLPPDVRNPPDRPKKI